MAYFAIILGLFWWVGAIRAALSGGRIALDAFGGRRCGSPVPSSLSQARPCQKCMEDRRFPNSLRASSLKCLTPQMDVWIWIEQVRQPNIPTASALVVDLDTNRPFMREC